MSTAPVWPGRRPRCTWPPSRTLQRSRRSRPLACSGELLLWRLRLLRGRPYRDLDVAGLEVDTTKAVRAFRGVDDEHLLELTLVAQARLDDLERVGHGNLLGTSQSAVRRQAPPGSRSFRPSSGHSQLRSCGCLLY